MSLVARNHSSQVAPARCAYSPADETASDTMRPAIELFDVDIPIASVWLCDACNVDVVVVSMNVLPPGNGACAPAFCQRLITVLRRNVRTVALKWRDNDLYVTIMSPVLTSAFSPRSNVASAMFDTADATQIAPRSC